MAAKGNSLAIMAQVPGQSTVLVIPDPGGLDPKTIKYVVADACVALVECNQCGAPIGSLCRGTTGRPTLSCHYTRRHAANGPKRRLRALGKLQGAWRIIFQPTKR